MQTEIHTSTETQSNVWWRLMRPHTLTASFVPVLTGTAIALFYEDFKPLLFLAMLVASLLIQAATNMFNEYYDYVRGLDNKESVGIGGTIVRDGVAPTFVRNLAFLFYFISVLIGIYICISSSWWVAVIGVISMAIGYLYTAGPYPIAYTPLGELFSGLFMGPVIIMITYFIQTGSLSWNAFYVSISVGIFIGCINLANNIRDLDGDKEGGRKTLAILLGRPKAIQFMATLFVIAYAWIIYLVIVNYVSAWVLLTLISIPKAVLAIKQFKGKTLAFEMMPAMKSTAQLNTMFGILLTLSFIIAYITPYL